MAGSCAVPDVRCALARDARDAETLGVSRIECADVRGGRWQTWSVVLQPGCGKSDCCGNCARVVSLGLFSRTNVLRRAKWLDRIQMRTFASRRAMWSVERTVSANWRSIFGGLRVARAFLDGALLLVR